MLSQDSAQPVRVAQAQRFFHVFSWVLLAIVLIGFAPTLFLRFLSDPAPMPFYLHLHGLVLTVWFIGLVVQTSLVRNASMQQHRRLGYFGAAYALVAIAGGLMATLGVVPRALEAGITFESDIRELGIAGLGEGLTFLTFISRVVWTNLVAVIAFAVLVAAAVWYRRQSAHHKRFMLLATITFVGPALARISRWPGMGGEQGPFIPLALLTLLIAVVVYDWRTLRKVHNATLVGIGVIVVAFAAGNVIAGTAAGQDFVRSLG